MKEDIEKYIVTVLRKYYYSVISIYCVQRMLLDMGYNSEKDVLALREFVL